MEPSEPSVNSVRVWAFAVLGSLVAVLGVCLAEFTDVDAVWYELCLHIGTGLLVGAVVFIAERTFVATARREVQHVERTLTEMREEILSSVDERIREAIESASQSDEETARRIRASASYEDLAHLFDRAIELDGIHYWGVRVVPSGSDIAIRVVHRREPSMSPGRGAYVDDYSELVVEEVNRKWIASCRWQPSEGVDDGFRKLAEAIKGAGRFQGTDMMEGLVDSVTDLLIKVIRSRSAADPSLLPIGHVLQDLDGGWAVTNRGLENFGHPDVMITIKQLRSSEPLVPDASLGYSPFTGRWLEVAKAAREIWGEHPSQIANSKGWDPYLGNAW
jgi:hypothetical protein